MKLTRVFWTLTKREAWEYRDWWTWVLGACIAVGVGALVLLSFNHPLTSSDTRGFRDAFFLQWFHALVLVGGSIMALAHAVHGVFDERQDRSIGFWQSWPVSEKTRLLAKSTAIAFGWPLLAAVATSILAVFCFAMGAIGAEMSDYYYHIFDMWGSMMKACALTAVWSWPIVCCWLWGSSHASKAPWAWGLGLALMVFAGGWAVDMDTAPLAMAISLGPVLPAVSAMLGEPGLLPWQAGSGAWGVMCALGWIALVHAARNTGDAAEV